MQRFSKEKGKKTHSMKNSIKKINATKLDRVKHDFETNVIILMEKYCKTIIGN